MERVSHSAEHTSGSERHSLPLPSPAKKDEHIAFTSLDDPYAGLRTNPFDGLGSDSAPAAMIIDYYVNFAYPTHAAVFKIFNITNTFNRFWIEKFSYSELLAANIALLSTIKDTLRTGTSAPSSSSLAYVQKAIHGLRLRIQSNCTCCTEIVCMTVFVLAAFSKLVGDAVSFDIHKSALNQLTSSWPADQKPLSVIPKASILQWDALWLMGMKGDSMFPQLRQAQVSTYPELPLEPHVLADVLLLPIGFRSLAVRGWLANDTLEILKRTADASIGFDRTGRPIFSSDDFRQAYPRPYADLWEACPSLYIRSDDDAVIATTTYEAGRRMHLNKIIILALILYCTHTFSPVRAIGTQYKQVRRYLDIELDRIDEVITWEEGNRTTGAEEEEEQQVKTWATMNLIDAWRTDNRDDPSRTLEQAGWERLRRLLLIMDNDNNNGLNGGSSTTTEQRQDEGTKESDGEVLLANLDRFYMNPAFRARCKNVLRHSRAMLAGQELTEESKT